MNISLSKITTTCIGWLLIVLALCISVLLINVVICVIRDSQNKGKISKMNAIDENEGDYDEET